MKRLIAILVITVACLTALMPLSYSLMAPVDSEGGSGGGGSYTSSTGGRIVSVFHYGNGIMTGVYNKDTDSYSNFVNGRIVSETLSSPNGAVTNTYTYNAKGFLTNSVNQYGDVTSYNDIGRQVSTTHQVQDYDNTTGQPIAGSKSIQTTSYAYDNYGHMTTASTYSSNGTLQSKQTYSYTGSRLDVINSYNAQNSLVGKTEFSLGRAVKSTSYGDNGAIAGWTTMSYNTATGRQSDTIYDKSGTVTGTQSYDSHNRASVYQDYAKTTSITTTYSGAKIVSDYSNVDKTTTYYDDWGNRKYAYANN